MPVAGAVYPRRWNYPTPLRAPFLTPLLQQPCLGLFYHPTDLMGGFIRVCPTPIVPWRIPAWVRIWILPAGCYIGWTTFNTIRSTLFYSSSFATVASPLLPYRQHLCTCLWNNNGGTCWLACLLRQAKPSTRNWCRATGMLCVYNNPVQA